MVVASWYRVVSQRSSFSKPRKASGPFDEDDLVDRGMMAHHRLSLGFDEICDARVWKSAPECADGGRREHDVPDQAQTDEQDVVYGSIVASSISITGMSSLIGYTR